MADWTISYDAQINGGFFNCVPIFEAWPWPAGVVVPLIPTPFNGHCQWFLEVGNSDGSGTYWSIFVFWNDFTPGFSGWSITLDHDAFAIRPNFTSLSSGFSGPATDSPIGLYTAIDDNGNTGVCTADNTCTITP